MEIWKNSMKDSHTNTHSRMTHCDTDSDPLLGCSKLAHQTQLTRTKFVLKFYPQLRNRMFSMPTVCLVNRKAYHNAQCAEPLGRFHSFTPISHEQETEDTVGTGLLELHIRGYFLMKV